MSPALCFILGTVLLSCPAWFHTLFSHLCPDKYLFLIVWEPRSPRRFPETISLSCSWSPLVGSSHSLSSTGTWPWSVSVQISGLFIWMVGKALCIPDWLGHTECWDYGYEPHFVHNSFFHKNTRPRVMPDLNLGDQSRSILRKII